MWWGSRDYVRSKTLKTKHLQNIGSFMFVKCKFLMFISYIFFHCFAFVFFWIAYYYGHTIGSAVGCVFFFPRGGEAKVGSPVEENLGTWGPAKRLDLCSKLEYRVHIDLNIYIYIYIYVICIYIYIFTNDIYIYICIDTCTFLSNTFASSIFGTCRCQVGRLASQARVA